MLAAGHTASVSNRQRKVTGAQIVVFATTFFHQTSCECGILLGANNDEQAATLCVARAKLIIIIRHGQKKRSGFFFTPPPTAAHTTPSPPATMTSGCQRVEIQGSRS